jgi:hypothetical protein
MFNVHKNQLSRQTGSRNRTVPKTLPVINSCLEKCGEKCAYMLNVYKSQLSRQTGSRNLTPTLLIFIHIEHIYSFFVTFFSATNDDRDLIFGHKRHIGTPYR